MSEIVSVALATYNGAKYLVDQLDSIACQSRIPDELVICDDCSSDDTIAIVQNFSKRAPFKVSITCNDHNLGYSRNFSNALQLCSGDYIFLCDQDDVWHPNKICRMLGVFHARPSVQLLVHNIDYCKEDLTRIGQTKLERMNNIYFNVMHDYVVGMATAIRAPFLRLCLPVPEEKSLSHDWWLHHCAATLGCKDIMKDVLALHRRHENNVTKDGSLNVDFVTTPEHFKKERSSPRGIFAKDSIRPIQVSALTEWLQVKREALVKQHLATTAQINSLIAEDILRVAINQKRVHIISLKRWQRFPFVLNLFKNGGYDCVAGWRSAVKDVLIN